MCQAPDQRVSSILQIFSKRERTWRKSSLGCERRWTVGLWLLHLELRLENWNGCSSVALHLRSTSRMTMRNRGFEFQLIANTTCLWTFLRGHGNTFSVIMTWLLMKNSTSRSVSYQFTKKRFPCGLPSPWTWLNFTVERLQMRQQNKQIFILTQKSPRKTQILKCPQLISLA